MKHIPSFLFLILLLNSSFLYPIIENIGTQNVSNDEQRMSFAQNAIVNNIIAYTNINVYNCFDKYEYENNSIDYLEKHINMDFAEYDFHVELKNLGTSIFIDDQKYNIYEYEIFFVDNGVKTKNKSEFYSISDDPSRGISSLMARGTVALGSSFKKIKFIGGFLFKDNILQSYLVKDKNTVDWVNYINLRYSNFLPENIQVSQNRRKYILLTFKSILTGGDYEVTIDKKYLSQSVKIEVPLMLTPLSKYDMLMKYGQVPD